jgi:hypothetical protein
MTCRLVTLEAAFACPITSRNVPQWCTFDDLLIDFFAVRMAANSTGLCHHKTSIKKWMN